MATTAITRRMFATATAAGLAVSALGFAPSAAADDAPDNVSPRVAERLYKTCIDGAPTTPDSHERWVAGCRERAAAGLS
jgi:hypothetical protein